MLVQWCFIWRTQYDGLKPISFLISIPLNSTESEFQYLVIFSFEAVLLLLLLLLLSKQQFQISSEFLFLLLFVHNSYFLHIIKGREKGRERERERERERTISLFDQILGKIFFDVWSVVEKKKTILRNFRKMIFGHTSRKCSISDLSKIKKHNMCLYWETNWPVDRGCIQHHRTLVQSSNPIHLWQNDAQWHKMLTNYAHYLIYAGKWPKISPEKQNFTNNVYIKSHWHPNCQYCV